MSENGADNFGMPDFLSATTNLVLQIENEDRRQRTSGWTQISYSCQWKDIMDYIEPTMTCFDIPSSPEITRIELGRGCTASALPQDVQKTLLRGTLFIYWRTKLVWGCETGTSNEAQYIEESYKERAWVIVIVTCSRPKKGRRTYLGAQIRHSIKDAVSWE